MLYNLPNEQMDTKGKKRNIYEKCVVLYLQI